MTGATQKSTWLKLLMENLHLKMNYSISLHCDNQYAFRLAENLVFHARTKHVEVQHHFITEKARKKEIEMREIKTDNQVVELKGLNTGKYEGFRYGTTNGDSDKGEC